MCTINPVCQGDVLLVAGDFNARVRSNQLQLHSNNVEWSGVRGIHAIDNVNEAGRALLTFCAVNDLTVMNTWHEKKNIYKYTWHHPGCMMWNCIYYVLVRQSQRTFYRDVSVIRKADCWTNHKIVCAKAVLQHKPLVAQQHARHHFAGYMQIERSECWCYFK